MRNESLNGRADHYPPTTFPSVWQLLEDAMGDGRIVAPREVFRELTDKEDDLAAWAKRRAHLFLDPSPETQAAAGVIYARFPGPGKRDRADPFVVAEAQVRGMTVVTYEGRSFSGVPTARWHRSMPGICKETGVPCATLPEALTMLGGSF